MKDYSTSSRFGALPITIIHTICSFLGLGILILITKNGFLSLIIYGVIDSFVILKISGKYIDKHCINTDISKCKNCHNWNCTRDIKK
jgi:hypothetical protein